MNNSLNDASYQSPNSSTIIDQSKVNSKLILEKFPLERTVTKDAEELGIIVPKTRNVKLKHAKTKKESDNIFDNSNKLVPRSIRNKPIKSITYGNNTIREESSDSEEKNIEKYMKNKEEFLKQERLFKRRISQKSGRLSLRKNDNFELQQFVLQLWL